MNNSIRTFVLLCTLVGSVAAQSLQVTSPAGGTVVNPGQTLTVSVSASGTFQYVMAIGQDPIGFSQEMLSGPPYQFTIQLPSSMTPGQYTLGAWGVTPSVQQVNSVPVWIDVELPDSPVSISVEPTVLNLYPGQLGYLRVVGTFADGASSELTASTSTTFSSSAPAVATVSAQGIVAPVGPGSAQILIDGSVSVPVTVAPQISIMPAQASLTASQTQEFVAFVANPANPAVTWSLNPGYGTVDANGNYTAPVAVPSQETDVLTATSVADNTQTASATITLLPTASVTVLPAWAVLYPSEPQQFTATTSNAGTAGVTWSISPTNAGTIDGTGLFTAPASISTTEAVTITATSVASSSILGSTTIYISPQPFNLLPQLPIVDVGPGTFHEIFIAELATDGFPHPVNYSVTGLPAGVAASLSPTTLTGTGQTTVTFSATAAAVQGSYPINVVGQDTVYAPLSQSVPLTLVVTPGFSFSLNPPAATTVPGGSVAVTVTESAPQGFSDAVLVGTNAANGITATFPQVQQSVQQFVGSGSAPLLFAVDPSLSPGSYPLTISGQDLGLGETSSVGFTLTVNAITGPSVLTMSPNPGTQTTQPLTFTFTDPAGGAAITTAGVLVNTSQATSAACFVQYTASTQTLSLSNDGGTGWIGSAVIGAYDELSNSQCLLDTGASQASVSGSTLTLTLVLTPVAPMIGTQNVYATVSDSSSSSGWVELGFWSISANSLPAPWRDQDIGTVSIAGNASYTSTTGTYTVYGSGTGTTIPPDQFHYTYRPLVGDGTIAAQLTTLSNITQYAEAGLMIRASTDPSTSFVLLGVEFANIAQPSSGACVMGVRATAGAAATYNTCSASLPLSNNPQYSGPAGWLQITRQGNTFSLQISPDGVNWTSAGTSVTVAMPANVLVGLAVSSSNAGGFTWGTFNNVSVAPASATATPTFSPAGGPYATIQTVAISSATSGALIRYTTDGSTPSETSGTLYTGPITISATTTINATAYSVGLIDSGVASATYTISPVVATPTFSPGSGTYSSPVSVTISTATSGASIRYTTDGSTPSETNGVLYNSPITVSGSITISAIAYATAMTDSAISSATYSLNSWSGNGYGYLRTIVIHHAQVPNTDQTNFPMVFNTTDPLFATVANGGHVTSPYGYDIIFTSDAGGTQKLNHEIESYNPATGQFIAWVQLPTVSHTDDTVIYLFYGNASITTSQANPTGVWDSNYQMVQHLPNGITLSANDSTSNGNNGTLQNSPTAMAGQIDGAAAFVGSSQQYIDLGNNATLWDGLTAMTWSAWIYPTANPGSNWSKVLNRGVDSGFNIDVGSSDHPGDVECSMRVASGTGRFVTTNNYVAGILNTWNYVTCAYDGSTFAFYLNGALVNSGNATGGPYGGGVGDYNTDVTIGTDALGNYFTGGIDEVRVSNAARSADWIATEYNNQGSPATFYSLSSEQSSGVPQVGTPTFNPVAGTYNSTQSVVISTTTPGASIRYTTDGSTPSKTSGILYSSPVTVSSSITINAIAYASGFDDSVVASAAYVINSGSNGYAYSRTITIAHSQVPNTDQINFPLVFNTTDPLLATVANGGHVTSPYGYDIIFTSDAGGTQKLNHEIESYNPATGQFIAWVQVPTVSHTNDTAIYLFYGNAGITTSQANPTSVWDSNYEMVQHLPNGITLSANDSTSNGINGTLQNSPTAMAGQIDGAASFVGTNQQYIDLGNNATLWNGLTAMTWSAWIYPTANPGSNWSRVLNRGIDGGFNIDVGSPDHPGDVECSMRVASGVGRFVTANNYVAGILNTWNYVTCAYDGSTFSFYLNGALVNGGSATGGPYGGGVGDYNTDVTIGTDALGNYFTGGIDEVRISKSARSADWIATEYNNQSSPGTFYSLGSETTH